MSEAFKGRVALVTGGSRGIGKATALRLAQEGADVAISYVTRAEAAREVVKDLRSLGRRAIEAKCDVSRPEEVSALVSRARRELGPIDLLAHCGAISNLCDHSELTFERWRETIDVNLNGAFLAVFAVKDEMMNRRFGRIVTISSGAALPPRKMQINYAPAKAGVFRPTPPAPEALGPPKCRTTA